jgi:asparagine synthase (glutamine-hydrolysing)
MNDVDGWRLSFTLDDPTHAENRDAHWAIDAAVEIFFEGLLTNRDELAAAWGVESERSTDAGVIAAGYRRYDERVFAHLRGVFVAAIVDPARHRVVVGRDPLGAHPLFFRVGANAIHFATTPQRLIDDGRTLNAAALADHLCSRWPRREETFFAGVSRAAFGSAVVIAGGRVEPRSVWHPAPPGQPVAWLEDDPELLFEARLDRAVARCMQAGRTAVFLSGGLDSIGVAAVAAARARRTGHPPPVALSLAFPDLECDERSTQTAVAATLNLPQHLVAFDDALKGRPLLPQTACLAKSFASPALNSWAPAYLGLAAQAQPDDVATIMTGLGGDEWLSVSVMLYADLLGAGNLRGFSTLLRTMLASHKMPRTSMIGRALWTFGMRPLGSRQLHRLAPQAWDRRRTRRQIAADPPWIAPALRLRDEVRSRASGSVAPADPPDGFYLQELRASLDHPIVAWELEEQYQIGRHGGVRLMHPYWDPDLVDALFRIPPMRLIEGGRAKGLVRRTLARQFPELGLDRQRKVSATSFHASVMARECPGLLAKYGAFPALGALGVVEPRAARAFAERAIGGTRETMYRVWDLINLEVWAGAQIGITGGSR